MTIFIYIIVAIICLLPVGFIMYRVWETGYRTSNKKSNPQGDIIKQPPTEQLSRVMTEEYVRKLMASNEKVIHEALMKMGWVPPAKPEKKVYELSEYGYTLQLNGVIHESKTPSDEWIRAGATRKTKSSAILASKRLQQSLTLSALAAELGGETEFVSGQKNWFVVKDGDTWFPQYSMGYFNPEKVYMIETCAVKIATMLNHKEFES